MLGIAACLLLIAPEISRAEERTDLSDSVEKPVSEETEENISKKAVETSKRFTEYFVEKVEQAQHEPWRETADQILINDPEVRWHRYLRALTDTPEWLDIGMAQRIRYEALTNNFRVGQATNINGFLLRTRLRLGVDWKIIRFFIEGQNSADLENQSAASTLNPSLASGDRLLQAFVAVKLENVFHTGLRTDLHLGRFTLDFGSRRFIARNEFRNTTNSFQGVHWNLAQEQRWRVRAFLVKPVSDTYGVLQPVHDTVFWGMQYEDYREPWLQTDLYYFGINTRASGGIQPDAFGTYGLRVYRASAPSQIDYESETTFQVGTVGGGDLFAQFQHAELGYSFPLPWQPRFRVQYDYASGTKNPLGNSSGRLNTLFGARNFEFTPTSTFGPFFRSNISSPGVRASLMPTEVMSLTVKYRAWWLAQAKDAWVGSGLQDPTGQAGNFLGQDVEARCDWHWDTFTLVRVGYDHFFKGSYIQTLAQVPGNPSAKDSDYFYVSTEFRF